jgi:hypothetical protein
MLAGVRQIAYQLAMVMAGFLVVALAHSIWVALFRADALLMFSPFDYWIHEIPIGMPTYASGYYEGIIGLGVVMWLIGYAIRRIASSVSSGRPA